jgi:SnoaL-like domain
MEMFEQRLESMERDLRALRDRQEIMDCVANHARGCDRQDSDLLAGVYHEGGFDEHGFAINPGPEYFKWANEQHSRGSLHSLHHITHQVVEIDGDEAHAESYVIGLMLNPDGKTARLLSGRYIDRLERREGQWGIVIRRSTVEIIMQSDASIVTSPAFASLGYLKGMRDKRDLSYRRPLTMADEGHERW